MSGNPGNSISVNPRGLTKSRPGWQDITSDMNSGKVAGANVPTWTAFAGGLYQYAFSASAMKEIFMNFHMPHDYTKGSAIFPHIHWAPDTSNTGVCRWGIEMATANGFIDEQFSGSSTVYLEQVGAGAGLTHQIVEVDEGIVIPGLVADGIILMRIFRDGGHANDTFTGVAFGLTADIHYQSDHYATVGKRPPYDVVDQT